MDFSDKIRRDQSKTIWTNYIATNLSKSATCNYSTCGAMLTSTCTVNYSDYAQRFDVNLGRQNTATCGTSISTFCLT